MTTPAEVSEPDLRYPLGHFSWPSQVTREQRQQWIGKIEEFPRSLAPVVVKLSSDQLDEPYRPDGWTVRQVVHHLADSHLNSYVRYRLALTENNPRVRGYDEKAWAELPDAKRSPIEPSLALLGGLHERWSALLQELTEEQWACTFEHSERGPMPLDATTGLYAWHGEHHLAQIRNRCERKDC